MRAINQDHIMCGSLNIKYKGQSFMSFCHFLSFYPHNNPENQTFEKMKKGPGDIIILHVSTINKNNTMYHS